MKIIKIYLVILALFSLQINSQWLADRFSDTDPVPPDWGSLKIQFGNTNTGWLTRFRDSVYVTTDGGLHWLGHPTVDTNILSSVTFINLITGWACGRRGKICKTTNGGTTWVLESSGVQSWLTDINFYDANTGFCVGSKDSIRVILKTTNGGVLWTAQNTSGTSKLFSLFLLSPQVAYSVGDSGTVLYTSNGGANWVNRNVPSISTLRGISIVGTSVTYLYVGGFNGKLFLSTNGGINWIDRSINTFRHIGSLQFTSIDTGYSGLQNGKIYKTFNGGSNWYEQPTAADTNSIIKSIYFINSQLGWALPDRGIVIYTTNGGGNPIGIQPISSEVPTGFSLEQNFPNPFNPNTKIQFSIPKISFIKLTVYDVIGRVLAILVNEELRPGKYEVDWDASHRASGVYYYKLETESYTETKKMVLLK